MPKVYLSREQEFRANKLLEANGATISPEGEPRIYKYNEGWDDQRIADEVSISRSLVATLRNAMWGSLWKQQKTVQTTGQRLDVVERSLSAQRELIGKDCDRLNIIIMAVQDLFRSLGLQPIDFSKAWEPPKDAPRVVSLPPEADVFKRDGSKRAG